MKKAIKSKINEIRQGLKLSSSELAHRLGINQSSALRLEQSESQGTISLNSLRKAAEALGCRLEYNLIQEVSPERSKQYRGLKRTRRHGASENSSKLSRLMKEDERAAAKVMTPEQRILRACELADLMKSLRNVS